MIKFNGEKVVLYGLNASIAYNFLKYEPIIKYSILFDKLTDDAKLLTIKFLQSIPIAVN